MEMVPQPHTHLNYPISTLNVELYIKLDPGQRMKFSNCTRSRSRAHVGVEVEAELAATILGLS